MDATNGGTTRHRYVSVRDPDPGAFGAALAGLLDRIGNDGGSVIHLSTQAIDDAGRLLYVGHVVYRALTLDGAAVVDVPAQAEEPMTLLDEQVAQIVDELP